ncbi:hypothetical protein [Marinivivus vitaminiproducens]|uniref:hypothetical protein n=1 Tax=Marinivivus vitaminiproducens TaxID=3035935 RepID=UPI00279ABE2E|nr:hypothetical protein P4R82_03785 [Geminicoccaceae bacterium SCSIO 64248]
MSKEITRPMHLLMPGYHINHVIDSDLDIYFKIDDAVRAIKNGNIFDILEERNNAFSGTLKDREKLEVLEEWRALVDTADSSRKFGIRESGYCLLMAYTLQLIQNRVVDS